MYFFIGIYKFFKKSVSRHEKYCHKSEDNKKSKIVGGEKQYVVPALPGVILGIFLEGNKACERGDKSAHASDIYAKEQFLIIVRKGGKENCRGHVADKLTGKCAENESALVKEGGKKFTHGVNSCHIARKDEEKHKCEKESVVNAEKCLCI